MAQIDMENIDNNQLFDLVLKEAGGFGRYQKLLLVLSLFVSILAASNHLSPIYLTYTPDYECIEGDPNSILQNITMVQPKCRFDDQTCIKWSYNSSVFNSSVVTQFDLICDRAALLPTIASSYMSGVVITITIMGYVSDSFGRRTIIITLSVVHILSSFITSFSSNFPMFVIVRFFVGGSIHAVWSAFFVLMAEIVPEDSRVLCGGVLNYGWNIGSLVMTFLAFIFRDWQNLQYSFACISVVLVFYFFIVPESPRWLISKGDTERAEFVMRRIAKYNGVEIEKTDFHQLFGYLVNDVKKKEWSNDYGSCPEITAKVTKILGNKEYFKRLALMIPLWFAVGLGSYGIHFTVQSVSNEMSIFAVAAIKEVIILTMIVCLIPIYKKMSRPTCVLCFYLIGGLVAISFIVPDLMAQNNPDSRVWEKLKITIYLIAQGLLVADFFLIDTYTPDIFSTDVRNLTFCFLDSISKIGTTIAPFIIYIGTVNDQAGIPPAIFGALMVLSSTCLLFLPETKDASLAQNVDEMKDSGSPSIFQRFRKNRKIQPVVEKFSLQQKNSA